jgi:hypothetical protein
VYEEEKNKISNTSTYRKSLREHLNMLSSLKPGIKAQISDGKKFRLDACAYRSRMFLLSRTLIYAIMVVYSFILRLLFLQIDWYQQRNG